MHFAKEKVEYTWNVICVRAAGKAGLDLLLVAGGPGQGGQLQGVQVDDLGLHPRLQQEEPHRK